MGVLSMRDLTKARMLVHSHFAARKVARSDHYIRF